jgi:hypothetical protein
MPSAGAQEFEASIGIKKQNNYNKKTQPNKQKTKILAIS